MKRQVSQKAWDLEKLGNAIRMNRLLDDISPDAIADSFFSEALKAANKQNIKMLWQESRERPSYFRLNAKIPITEETFDRLFNGRSGYRAQYYLSPEEGVLYNRQLINGLHRSMQIAYATSEIDQPFDNLWLTLTAPHAKIWLFKEQAAFDQAAANTLNPPRWVENLATRGRRAPLPAECCVDLKGAFLIPGTDDLFVDDFKLSRPHDLHCRGYT